MPKKNPWTYRRRKTKKKNNSGSVPEGELILCSRLSDPGDLLTSIGLISEIPLNNRVKDEEQSYPDTRFEHSTTLFPAKGILEDHLPSETPCESFKRCAEELTYTIEKHNKKVKTSDSTKTVGPIPDVMIIENPKTPIKAEVIDLTDDCHPTFPIMCYPVKTNYRQNRRKPNTLQVNGDAAVKVESSKNTRGIISDIIGATNMNYSILAKVGQNKDSEVFAVKSHVDIYKHITTSVDNPTNFQVKTEKDMPCESFNEVHFGGSRIESPADNPIQINAEKSQSKENNTEATFQKSQAAVSKHADTTTRNISERSEMEKENEENRKTTPEIYNNKITGVVSSEKLITNLLNDISISPITDVGIFDRGDLQSYEQGTFRTPLLKYLNCNTKVDIHAMSYALSLLNNLTKDKEQINLIDLEDNFLATISLLPLDDNKRTETSSNLPMEAKKNSVPMFSNDFLRQILVNAKSKEESDDIAVISSPMNPSVNSALKSNIVIDDSGFQNRLKNKQGENMNSTSDANEKNSESTIKNSENFSKSLVTSNENGFKRTQGILFDPPSTFSNGFKNPVKKVKISEAASLFKSGSLRTISHEEYRGTCTMDNPCYQPDHHHLGKHLTSHFPSNSSDSSSGQSNTVQNIFTPTGNRSFICSDTSLQNPGYRHMVNANYLQDSRLARYGLPTFIRDGNSQKQLGSSNMSRTYLSQSVQEATKSTVHFHMKQTPLVSTFYATQNSSRMLSPAEPFRRTFEKNTVLLLPSTTSGSSSSTTECNPDPSVQAVKGHQPLLSLPHLPGKASSPF